MSVATLEREQDLQRREAAVSKREAEAKNAKKGEKKKGFITSLLDDLIELIEKSDQAKKEQLTATTKTPTKETVVAAFDAATDVTAGATAAYRAKQAGNLDEAIRLQRAAEAKFLAQDALVREGALLVLYVQAEAEYRENQLRAVEAEAKRSTYDLAA